MRGFFIGALALALTVPAAAANDEAEAGADLGSGMASYFSREMAGNRTANGERCDPDTLTAAHRTAPFGSRIDRKSVV